MRAWLVDSEDSRCFVERELPDPQVAGRDLLVRVEAVSVNPVDTKVRPGRPGAVLGWDAVGEVVAIGDGVQGFRPGDRVFYAGDITRPGTDSTLHEVDERIVGHAPRTLDALQAAALPLTGLTAWEGLHDHLDVQAGQTLLVVNGAGGVGSMVIQLAKASGLTVIATASRPQTVAWCRQLGADHVVDHRGDVPGQLAQLGIPRVNAIFCAHDPVGHFDTFVDTIEAFGRIVCIVGTDQPLPMGRLMNRSVRFCWELMYTRPMFGTVDQAEQGRILDRIAELVDAGTLRTTLTEDGGVLSADSLAAAHRRVESGTMIGKIALRMP